MGIAALDARLSVSSLRVGWSGHSHVEDACASLAQDGALVTREDLVLRDAFMDVRYGSQELGQAHHVLRARRMLLRRRPAWALTADGIDTLLERRPPKLEEDGAGEGEDGAEDDEALIEATAMEAGTHYGRWLEVAGEALRRYPALIAAALAWDAWRALRPLGRGTWLGRLLIGSLLRLRRKTRRHLLTFNLGLQRMHYRPLATHPLERRLAGALDAMAAASERGLALLERLEQAQERLALVLQGRRSTSHLPDVIDLILSRPLVSAPMLVKELRISRQAATQLIDEVRPHLRELTGRGRYRAWGVV
ncbi:helix-turn-helix domain-containing protein [Marinivivus vitaminiproducens]|uniref:helix-turn-helix domain-containing protein n=1 Tax=Marinivivus vitaminiproducens TaxID=3035935 RepID=UPI00279DE0FC|nr:helix-turn-helix domain-containing protein [Geminicoccaceae bacterium SCSIO 64248]